MKEAKNKIIPVIMMFDKKYALPAGVAMYSLLKNSSPLYNYNFHILHNNISSSNIKLLTNEVKKFKNASIDFIDMNNKFEDIWKDINANCFFTKELLYKLLVPEIFPQYKKAIITDVDVLFLGDVSDVFENFVEDAYLCCTKEPNPDIEFFANITDNKAHSFFGAGFMLYNLEAMRKDNIQEKLIEYLCKYKEYLDAPEQEILSQVCFENVKFIHPKYMTLVIWYNETDDRMLSNKGFQEALTAPVQLHYIHKKNKPWLYPFKAIKSKLWFKYLLETDLKCLFIKDYISFNLSRLKKLFAKRRR